MQYRHIFAFVSAIAAVAAVGILYFNITEAPKKDPVSSGESGVITAIETVPFNDTGSRPLRVLYVGSETDILAVEARLPACDSESSGTANCRSIDSILGMRKEAPKGSGDSSKILFENAPLAREVARDWGMITSTVAYGGLLVDSENNTIDTGHEFIDKDRNKLGYIYDTDGDGIKDSYFAESFCSVGCAV